MNIFWDILELVKSLSFVDIVFFFAVMILMILIVTLIYFIKINNEEDSIIDKEETAEMKIVKEIQKNLGKEEPVTNFTEYEKDQEDKAVISYDELLNKTNNYELNYENEELHDDLSIKKVNLDDLVNKNVESTPKVDVRVISFAKEEAFLQALKQLQKELG